MCQSRYSLTRLTFSKSHRYYRRRSVTTFSFVVPNHLLWVTGVIPTTLVYLGSFYKSTELATRLAFFWGVQQFASAVSGLMASGLLKMRGIYGLEGWKWLFLIDGIITLIVAGVIWYVNDRLNYTRSDSVVVRSYFPKDVTSTQGGLRGPNSWFTHRQTQIAATRLVRDDLSKRSYEYVSFFHMPGLDLIVP